jgi:hypothetical protein
MIDGTSDIYLRLHYPQASTASTNLLYISQKTQLVIISRAYGAGMKSEVTFAKTR